MVEIQNNENVQLRVEDNNQNLINNNQPNLIDVQNAENNSPLINEPFKDNPNFDLSNQQNPNNMGDNQKNKNIILRSILVCFGVCLGTNAVLCSATICFIYLIILYLSANDVEF